MRRAGRGRAGRNQRRTGPAAGFHRRSPRDHRGRHRVVRRRRHVRGQQPGRAGAVRPGRQRGGRSDALPRDPHRRLRRGWPEAGTARLPPHEGAAGGGHLRPGGAGRTGRRAAPGAAGTGPAHHRARRWGARGGGGAERRHRRTHSRPQAGGRAPAAGRGPARGSGSQRLPQRRTVRHPRFHLRRRPPHRGADLPLAGRSAHGHRPGHPHRWRLRKHRLVRPPRGPPRPARHRGRGGRYRRREDRPDPGPRRGRAGRVAVVEPPHDPVPPGPGRGGWWRSWPSSAT